MTLKRNGPTVASSSGESTPPSEREPLIVSGPRFGVSSTSPDDQTRICAWCGSTSGSSSLRSAVGELPMLTASVVKHREPRNRLPRKMKTSNAVSCLLWIITPP